MTICRSAPRRAAAPTRCILIDVHARFTETEALRAARRLAPLGIYWWEEPTTRDRQETVHAVAAASPIPVATGEMYDTVGQFFTLAERGGVNIFQPEPMSLGGISQHAGGRRLWRWRMAATSRRTRAAGRWRRRSACSSRPACRTS